MTITAKVVADSISPQGIRLTTLELRYPKFIHGEFMTHRVFSRNASSSRAIPVERLIQDVLADPAMPVSWGRNQPGMQAVSAFADNELIDFPCEETFRSCPEDPEAYFEQVTCRDAWRLSMVKAVDYARMLAEAGLHKQIVNRLLEPFCHIKVVVTATEWANFFALRRHTAAQPEMRALADAIWDVREASTPALLQPGQWHLPYCPDVHGKQCTPLNDDAIKLSVARCARVSRELHDGTPSTVEKDVGLHDMLVAQEPLHASPAEHQATPDDIDSVSVSIDIPTGEQKSRREVTGGLLIKFRTPREHGNFVGWRQYRKMLSGENITDR